MPLYRVACDAVRLGRVAVYGVEVHRPPGVVVIALVARQGEVIEVRLRVGRDPIMVAQGREELVEGGPLAVAAQVGVNEVVVILADVGVYGRGIAVGVIVIANCDDEVGVPTMNQVGHIKLRLSVATEVTDDGKVGARGGNRRRRHPGESGSNDDGVQTQECCQQDGQQQAPSRFGRLHPDSFPPRLSFCGQK